MEKTISAFDVRRKFGQVLQAIIARGDKYIVERHGEPVAVVVPIDVYEQWKQSRNALFETLQRAQERANLSPEQADRLAEEAVAAVRTPPLP